jgi:hypothetical protein
LPTCYPLLRDHRQEDSFGHVDGVQHTGLAGIGFAVALALALRDDHRGGADAHIAAGIGCLVGDGVDAPATAAGPFSAQAEVGRIDDLDIAGVSPSPSPLSGSLEVTLSNVAVAPGSRSITLTPAVTPTIWWLGGQSWPGVAVTVTTGAVLSQTPTISGSWSDDRYGSGW